MQGGSSFASRGDFRVQIRVGYELIYRCPQATPMILNLNIHYTRAADLIRADNMLTDPWVPLVLYRDGFGNLCTRLVAPAGRMRITADAIINDDGVAEPVMPNAQQHPVESLPEETLVYLLGSRYWAKCRFEMASLNQLAVGSIPTRPINSITKATFLR